jgi:hypothetical protein
VVVVAPGTYTEAVAAAKSASFDLFSLNLFGSGSMITILTISLGL